MQDRRTHIASYDDAGRYEVRIAGHLDARWGAWFDGLTVIREAEGTTVISGAIADQAELHGLLQRVRDLGLALISVTRTAADTKHITGAR